MANALWYLEFSIQFVVTFGKWIIINAMSVCFSLSLSLKSQIGVDFCRGNWTPPMKFTASPNYWFSVSVDEIHDNCHIYYKRVTRVHWIDFIIRFLFSMKHRSYFETTVLTFDDSLAPPSFGRLEKFSCFINSSVSFVYRSMWFDCMKWTQIIIAKRIKQR